MRLFPDKLIGPCKKHKHRLIVAGSELAKFNHWYSIKTSRYQRLVISEVSCLLSNTCNYLIRHTFHGDTPGVHSWPDPFSLFARRVWARDCEMLRTIQKLLASVMMTLISIVLPLVLHCTSVFVRFMFCSVLYDYAPLSCSLSVRLVLKSFLNSIQIHVNVFGKAHNCYSVHVLLCLKFTRLHCIVIIHFIFCLHAHTHTHTNTHTRRVLL